MDGIYHIKEHNGRVFTDIVYEWEEDLSNLLNVPILHWGTKHDIAAKILHRLPSLSIVQDLVLHGRSRRYLSFVMNALEGIPFFNHPSYMPVIIDYFVDDNKIDDFIRLYDQCENVYVSSRQAYEHLNKMTLPFRVTHLPLTLSDRYRMPTDIRYDKQHALTVLGTQIYDPVLRGYINEYCATHPDFIYVYKEDGGERYVTSKGDNVCYARDRNEYFQLLRASKVTLYSTPEMRTRPNCHGFDPVTPKLIEMIASQCHVIMRYPDNEDTRFWRLSDLSSSVQSYEDFATQLDTYLHMKPNLKHYAEWLSPHYTSTLQNILLGDIHK